MGTFACLLGLKRRVRCWMQPRNRSRARSSSSATRTRWRRPRCLASFVGGAPITKTDGNFALTGLVPNTPVTLYAEYDGQRTNTVTVEVGPSQVRSDLMLRLP